MINFYDRYYDVLNIVSMLIEGWCAIKLFRAFVEPRLSARFAKYAVGAWWAAVNITISMLIENGVDNLALLIKLIAYTLCLILFTVIWYKGGLAQRLFPVLLFSVIRELSVQMTNCFTIMNNIIIDLLWWMTDEGELIPLEMFPTVTYISMSVIMTLIMVLRTFVVFSAANAIVKNYRYKTEPGKESLLNLLPSAVALTVGAMLRVMLLSMENGYTVIIYERFPALYIIIPIMSAGLLAAVIYSFKLYQDMTGMRLGQADRAVLESQLTGMQNALAEKERLYESMNSVRHDMRNSIAALRGLISRKCPDDEEINRYFESMSLPLMQAESRIQTGSAVCDAIIGDKLAAAERELPDIKLDADGFMFTDAVRADPYDIGVILSNGLDNATEACRRLRERSPKAEIFITVRSFMRKNMFFTEIENSFDGVLRTDTGGGLPLSLKENDGLHGIGLRNIKNCAEKYSGSMDYIVENGKFTLSVMLKT